MYVNSFHSKTDDKYQILEHLHINVGRKKIWPIFQCQYQRLVAKKGSLIQPSGNSSCLGLNKTTSEYMYTLDCLTKIFN